MVFSQWVQTWETPQLGEANKFPSEHKKAWPCTNPKQFRIRELFPGAPYTLGNTWAQIAKITITKKIQHAKINTIC